MRLMRTCTLRRLWAGAKFQPTYAYPFLKNALNTALQDAVALLAKDKNMGGKRRSFNAIVCWEKSACRVEQLKTTRRKKTNFWRCQGMNCATRWPWSRVHHCVDALQSTATAADLHWRL